MWRILEGRSIYMNDARRIGKTMILTKMHEGAPSGWVVMKRDLEGLGSAEEFAARIYKDVEHSLSGFQRGLRRLAEAYKHLGGIEISHVVKLPNGAPVSWKDVLGHTFSDLEKTLEETDQNAVFLWDEVPFLLEKIMDRGGPAGVATAMEILDFLRAVSQDNKRIRFVLTGSVGLHHILSDLREKGYGNSPLNHMEFIAPGPLDPAAACALARALIAGEALVCEQPEEGAAALARAVDNVAFYIHKLVARWPEGKPLNPGTVEEVMWNEVAGPANDWDLAHYRNRLRNYYGSEEPRVLRILDAVAVAEAPISFQDILKNLGVPIAPGDEEKIRVLLKLLQQDHYLERSTETGAYRFRFSLIQRWWRFERNLSS